MQDYKFRLCVLQWYHILRLVASINEQYQIEYSPAAVLLLAPLRATLLGHLSLFAPLAHWYDLDYKSLTLRHRFLQFTITLQLDVLSELNRQVVEYWNSNKLRRDKAKKLNIRTRWEPHIQIDCKYGSTFGFTYIPTPKSHPLWLAFRILSSTTSVQTPRTPPDSAPEHNGENSITLLLSSLKL